MGVDGLDPRATVTEVLSPWPCAHVERAGSASTMVLEQTT